MVTVELGSLSDRSASSTTGTTLSCMGSSSGTNSGSITTSSSGLIMGGGGGVLDVEVGVLLDFNLFSDVLLREELLREDLSPSGVSELW